MAGAAAIYSIVIAHQALRLEREKYDESKKVAIRVELREEAELKPADEGDVLKPVHFIGMHAYNDGAVPVRLTEAWLEVGPENSPFPVMSESITPGKSILVEPYDSKMIAYDCGALAKRAAEINELSGTTDLNGYFRDSFQRKHRNAEPLEFDINMFYRRGSIVEDPFMYMDYACADCKINKNINCSVAEILKKQQELRDEVTEPPADADPLQQQE